VSHINKSNVVCIKIHFGACFKLVDELHMLWQDEQDRNDPLDMTKQHFTTFKS